MNRTLYDKARTILNEANLPKHLWGESILCSTYLINRSPSQAINYEIPAKRFHRSLDLRKLKIFGSKCWMVNLPRGNKFDKRAKEMRMVGYARTGYRLWDPETDTVVEARDVRFDETDIRLCEDRSKINQDEPSTSNLYQYEEYEESRDDKEQEPQDNNKEIEESTEMKTKSGRQIKAPEKLNEYELYQAYCLTSFEDPQTYSEAIQEGWKEAIDKELEAHMKMKTWTSTVLPEGKEVIDTKWVFSTKKMEEKGKISGQRLST